MGDNETRLYIFPTVILYIFFLFFAHLWWFGGWLVFWGLGFGFWGWSFQLMGFCDCGVGFSGFFWDWGSLYKHRRMTLRKKIM